MLLLLSRYARAASAESKRLSSRRHLESVRPERVGQSNVERSPNRPDPIVILAEQSGFRPDQQRRRNGHEEERVAENQVSFSADRCENQGTRRLRGKMLSRLRTL